MRIVDQGRQRDYETGEPVDRVTLEDAEYEEVAVRQVDGDTVVVSVQPTDGEARNIVFEKTNHRYVGIVPTDEEFGSFSTELRTILNYIGYADVADTEGLEDE